MITNKTIPLTEIEYWKPTMNLRWKIERYGANILEQQWANNSGEVEWREIPTV